MRIGKWRHRVALQQPGSADDAFGQPQPAWTTLGTYWSEVATVTGTEANVAEQLKAIATHRVRMRNPRATDGSDQVDPTMQLIHRGRVLRIVATNVTPDRRYLECLCQEVLTGG